MIIIDGSHHEGGGQIIRTAVALSALTGKAVRITNIRAKRCNPGLAAQHLTGVLALSKLCSAKVSGAEIGSQTLDFIPGEIKGGNFSFDVGTAGAISLVMQALALPAVHAKEEAVLEITGGTDVLWGPTVSYFQRVFGDFLKKMGVEISVEILRHGFYPKGGGKARLSVKPCKKLKQLNLTERGALKGVHLQSIASETLKGAKVAERQAESAAKIFGKEKIIKADVFYVAAQSISSSLFALAEYDNCVLGASSVGERGKPAEKVGEEAAKLLKKQMDSGACLDEWMADQIVPYLAIATGAVSVAEITPHVQTNIWVVEQFFGNMFEIDKERKIIKVKNP